MLSRRGLLGASAAVAGAGLAFPGTAHAGEDRPATARQALAALAAGNRRWVSADLAHRDPVRQRRRRVAGAQHPFAVVFTCIDSRVPPEFVFDQDLGDLFVVRTAGEALDALVAGSVEYGPAHGVPLVLVLGHSGCGAMAATVESIEDGVRPPGHLPAVVDALAPAYHAARALFRPGWSRAQRVDAAARVNVRLAVARIGPPAVGGFYDLRSGAVDFSAG